MKLVTASGKTTLKIDRQEWENIGRKNRWLYAALQSKLSTEEIAEAWKNSEEDIKINDRGEAIYMGKVIVSPTKEGNPNFFSIWKWMQENQYFPNVWEINDHGNVEMISIGYKGAPSYLGGLV